MTTPYKLLVFTLVMALSVIPCYAQYENYYKVDNNTYVTTMPNAEIYELQSNCITPNCREIINTQNSKTKKIKRPQQLRVLRYTNTLKQRDFNAYVVEYKDKEWVLQDSYVQDNTLLKQRSNQMTQSQESITTNHQDLEKQLEIKKQQFNELLLSYKSQCADSMNYYKELKSRLPAIRDSLVAVKRAQEQAKVDKVYKEWYNIQPASTKRAANIISISSAELGYPNSAGGCDYTLLYTNKSKKTIKYLYWSGTTYNAVNDPVYCEIRSTSYFSGKDTGPVEYNEVGGGSWDCIIYNYSADRLKLENISITYMDGSSASIGAADIKRLLKAPSTDVYISSFDIELQMISSTGCQNKIDIWKERLGSIESKKFYKGWLEKYHNDNSYNSIWLLLENKSSEIKDLSNRVFKSQKEVKQFDKFINFETYTSYNGYNSYSSNKYNSTSRYGSTNKKSPFVTFGLEGSFEGLKSFSTGWGVIMRIGRFNSLFNATVGIKYQYTHRKEFVGYVYSDSKYNVYSGYANYTQRANQLIIPLTVNCNLYKDDYFAYYLGVGYEHGLLSATTRKYENPSDDFSIDRMRESGDCDDIINISTPSRTVIFQMGFAGRHWDWKAYYKLYTNKSIFINGDPGAIGTAFTYYFYL